MDASTPAPALPFPDALTPLPEVVATWQTRWDGAWQSLHNRARQLREAWRKLEHQRLSEQADRELRARQLRSEAESLYSERRASDQEIARQRQELAELQADAEDAWRAVAAERAAWEQWEADHAATRMARTEELAGLEQRIQHQRQVLASLTPSHVRTTSLPAHDGAPATMEPATQDFIAVVAELVQDLADQARLVDEQWQMLERLKTFWTRRWEQLAESYAERDDTLERLERNLDLREGWLSQKEAAATIRAEKLRDLQITLKARQALLTRKETRHNAQRSKLALAVKRRLAQWLREELPEVLPAIPHDAVLDLHAQLRHEQVHVESREAAHQSEVKQLREDRALLREQVRTLEEELEQLAFALLEEPPVATPLRLVA